VRSVRDGIQPAERRNAGIRRFDQASESPQETPESLDHFDLLDRLGMGAFGTVWRAHDKKLDRAVAIKIPLKDQLTATKTEWRVFEPHQIRLSIICGLLSVLSRSSVNARRTRGA
jgi:serine/threonine protein kinase